MSTGGSKWPSTTEVLDFFGLKSPYFSDEAAQRGQLVHAGCHLLGRGQMDPAWEARHPECHGYLDAYRKFLREHRFRLVEWETEFKSETHRFISHPDQLGFFEDNSRFIDLELKSGSMPPWCQLQTAGQVLAMGDPGIRRFGLLLKSDGDYKLYPHKDFRDIDRFRNMIETYWTIQEFRDGDARDATSDRS